MADISADASPPLSSGILFQSEDSDVFVIDIPASISAAQNWAEGDVRHLLSCPAVEHPWPDNEPKSAKAATEWKLVQEQERSYHDAIRSALATVKSAHAGQYCLVRNVSPDTASTGDKRSISEALTDTVSMIHDHCGLSDERRPRPTFEELSDVHAITSHDAQLRLASKARLDSKLVCNATRTTAKLQCYAEATTFMIPPGSAFFHGDCASPRSFHRYVADLARQLETRDKFDIIVMDPPWPNASVRRGAHRGHAHYNTTWSMGEMRQLLLNMRLGGLVSEDGLLAVWITNKATIRRLVLSGEDGLFHSMGMQLIEEWTSVKVTAGGEPVLPLDGYWRKPYEILLIGRRQPQHAENVVAEVKRRFIVAVPDLHSRKPNLKHTMEEVFALAPDKRGLEIFARNLTSGWCSWGNEVLRFNDEACWSRPVR